jgi:glycosyltransferase involved in cell wall biosynthesis
MIRVAHVGNYKPDSANGVHKTICGLVDHLPQSGVAVELWHPTDRVTAVTRRQVGNLLVIDLPIHRNRLCNALRLPATTRATLPQQAKAVDLIHLHSVFTPVNAWIATLGVPYLLTPHGGYDSQVLTGRNRLIKQFWLWWRERQLIRNAAALHAVSPPEQQQLRRVWGHAAVFQVPNAIELAAVPPPPAPPAARSHWGFLGRLAVEQKGLDILARAYAQATTSAGSTIPPVTLSGPDFRNGKQTLEALAKELMIQQRLGFAAPVFGAAKWDFLAQTRIFLHPSRWEGMPFALLEAMAMECPVIVTPETNLAKWITEYDAGWVSAGTVAQLAETFRAAALASDQLLNQKGANARRMVSELFTWPQVAAQMAREYTKVLHAR